MSETPICPSCGADRPYKINVRTNWSPWRCRKCRCEYSAKTGTVFAKSKHSFARLIAVVQTACTHPGCSVRDYAEFGDYRGLHPLFHRLFGAFALMQATGKCEHWGLGLVRDGVGIGVCRECRAVAMDFGGSRIVSDILCANDAPLEIAKTVVLRLMPNIRFISEGALLDEDGAWAVTRHRTMPNSEIAEEAIALRRSGLTWPQIMHAMGRKISRSKIILQCVWRYLDASNRHAEYRALAGKVRLYYENEDTPMARRYREVERRVA